jgi:hypothetical protein
VIEEMANTARLTFGPKLRRVVFAINDNLHRSIC